MYIPPHFAVTETAHLHRILREHPLATLVTPGEDGGPDADHIPFEFDAQAGAMGMLNAHVARANSLWQRCPTGTPVLAIFRGAQDNASGVASLVQVAEAFAKGPSPRRSLLFVALTAEALRLQMKMSSAAATTSSTAMKPSATPSPNATP